VQRIIQILASFDTNLFYFINRRLSCWFLDVTMPVVTDLHKSWMVVSAILILVLAWIAHRGRRGLAIILVVVFATSFADLVNAFAIKQEFKRERPQFVLSDVKLRSPAHYGYSFPSNHATNCFTIATVFASAFPEWGLIAFFGAAVIAFSRVYVGVHFPLDVTASALVGVVLGRAIWWLGQGTVERQRYGWRRSAES
jgi:undecaprenyl-diphosphatase